MHKDTAVSFARLANNQLADVIRQHPARFSGMVASAPRELAEAAREIERGRRVRRHDLRMGMDRVMYAIDYPYQHAIEEVPMLDRMSISAADNTRFFQTHAETAFRIQ
jgi:predicted TIM-barrel fold metal-dependent hydrolase